MDEPEIRARLTDEFRAALDGPLIHSILGDFDLGNPKDKADARKLLLSLAATAPLEEASGFDAAGLGQEQGNFMYGGTADATSLSTTGTISSPTSRSSPPATLNPDGLQPFAAARDLELLSDKEKVERLQFIFPTLKCHDIEFSLKKSNGNLLVATDDLLTIQYLETTGQRQKGVDAFFIEDDYSSGKKGKNKKKGKSKGTNQDNKRPNCITPPSNSSKSSTPTPGCSASGGSSETGTSSDIWAPALGELADHELEEVNYVAIRLNIAESEVANVYVASNYSLPETVDCFVETFRRIGFKEAHTSLKTRIEHMRTTYPSVPHRFLPCIADMTETQGHANDIAGILQGYYAKPGKTKLEIDYNLKPADIAAEEPELERTGASTAVHVNRPTRPVLALTPVPTSSTPSAVPRSTNPWNTVQSKRNWNGSKLPNVASPVAPSFQTVTPSRDATFRAAARAYRNGTSNSLWRQAAIVYHEKGIESQRKATAMKADHSVAASRTENSVDLHGVFVVDGIRIAKQAVEEWWAKLDAHPGAETRGRTRLARELGGFKIVTGQGIHSVGGRSRLRPAILEALVQDGWNVQSSTGVFSVMGRT